MHSGRFYVMILAEVQHNEHRFKIGITGEIGRLFLSAGRIIITPEQVLYDVRKRYGNRYL